MAAGGQVALWQGLVEYVSSEEKTWGLEDNTAWYGHEKKLWLNIAVCLLYIIEPFQE